MYMDMHMYMYHAHDRPLSVRKHGWLDAHAHVSMVERLSDRPVIAARLSGLCSTFISQVCNTCKRSR